MLYDLHVAWAWMVIVGNGLAGLWALGAHALPGLRIRSLWWLTALVEAAIFVQAGLGVGLMTVEGRQAPELHVFYGFVAMFAVGIVYSYRQTSPWVRDRPFVVYGLAGLFLMGLGIRGLLIGQG